MTSLLSKNGYIVITYTSHSDVWLRILTRKSRYNNQCIKTYMYMLNSPPMVLPSLPTTQAPCMCPYPPPKRPINLSCQCQLSFCKEHELGWHNHYDKFREQWNDGLTATIITSSIVFKNMADSNLKCEIVTIHTIGCPPCIRNKFDLHT